MRAAAAAIEATVDILVLIAKLFDKILINNINVV